MSSVPQVFISYSREDAAVMISVRTLLARAGVEAWTDEGIEVGTPNWQLAIERAIEESACLVCVLTPAAKRSAWVREELAYATFHEKPIYMLHAAGDYRQVAILGFTVAQLIDVRDESQLAPRLDQLARVVRAAAGAADGETTRYFSPPTQNGVRADSGAPHSQAEELVRYFLPVAVPTTERHVLTVVRGADRVTKPALRLDQLLLALGRGTNCALRFNDESVSREHAQLVYTREGFVLRDLQSANGTFVNDRRVEVCALCDGDTLRVGLHCVLHYSVAIDATGAAP
jgi:hypothetical protein